MQKEYNKTVFCLVVVCSPLASVFGLTTSNAIDATGQVAYCDTFKTERAARVAQVYGSL
jgi:hypothetical protein